MATSAVLEFPRRLRNGADQLSRAIQTAIHWGTTGTSGFVVGATFTFIYILYELVYWVAGINYAAELLPSVFATTTPFFRGIDCFGKFILVVMGWVIWDKNTPNFMFSHTQNRSEDLK